VLWINASRSSSTLIMHPDNASVSPEARRSTSSPSVRSVRHCHWRSVRDVMAAAAPALASAAQPAPAAGDEADLAVQVNGALVMNCLLRVTPAPCKATCPPVASNSWALAKFLFPATRTVRCSKLRMSTNDAQLWVNYPVKMGGMVSPRTNHIPCATPVVENHILDCVPEGVVSRHFIRHTNSSDSAAIGEWLMAK
jgi:hypothetical protein